MTYNYYLHAIQIISLFFELDYSSDSDLQEDRCHTLDFQRFGFPQFFFMEGKSGDSRPDLILKYLQLYRLVFDYQSLAWRSVCNP